MAAGSIAFLIGQYCAPKIKSNQKYNMKSLLILFMMWIFRKLLWKTAPTKLDVLYYMLLGIIGVFIWPIVFEKIRSRRCMNLLKRMGGIFYNTVGGVLGGLMYCAVMKARKRL